MLSVLLTETRPDTSVPYFRQHVGDICGWASHINRTVGRFCHRLRHYNVRFSDDLLTRYILTVFDDRETMEALNSSYWYRVKEVAHGIYCESRNIRVETTIVQHGSEQDVQDYMRPIVERTWPRSQVLVIDAFLPGLDNNDRLLTNARKPENDEWELHPWYLWLKERY